MFFTYTEGWTTTMTYLRNVDPVGLVAVSGAALGFKLKFKLTFGFKFKFKSTLSSGSTSG
jgi:hypothetical protein